MQSRRRQGFPGESLIVLSPTQRQQLSSAPMSRHLHFTDIGYFPRACDHYVEREKGTKEYVLQFCLGGEGFNEFEEQMHAVSAQEYFVLPPGKRHVYGSSDEGGWKVGWIHFGGSTATELADVLTPRGFGTAHTLNVAPSWHQRFSDIVGSLADDLGAGNVGYCNSRLWSILSALAYRESAALDANRRSPVDKALHFMQENLATPIRLETLARAAGLSSSRFSAVFRRETGVPPKEYLRRLRMKRACRYLTMTDMSVKAIAEALGYSDPYYFSRSFKQQQGLSPTHYRQQQTPASKA